MLSFEENIKKLQKIILKSKKIATEVGSEINLSAFELLLEKLNNPQLYVAVVGRTSSGKTTLINSLLGTEILPQNAAPTTAAITEVYNSFEDRFNYYKVDNKMKKEVITKNEFNNIFNNAEDFEGRLQLEVPTFNFDLKARIFDTPGYDSIYEEDSQVLDSFIPEADFLVFTVMYRTGLTQPDKDFLEMLYEIFGERLPPLVLVINRIPPKINNADKRIKEIKRDVDKIIKQDLKIFFIKEDRREESSLADTNELWSFLAKESKKQERKKELIDNVIRVLDSLLDRVEDYILYAKKIKQADLKKKEQLKEEVKNLEREKREIYKLINDRKEKIIIKSYKELKEARRKIYDKAKSEIEKAGRWSKASECSSYLINHFLPQQANKLSRKVGKIVFKELDKLNREVEDMVNTAIGNFETQINDTLFKENVLAETIAKSTAKKGINSVAFSFLAQFGGQGGAGAGVANFASKALKKAGDLFNKKFSLATHNGLKVFLKKIGLTSAKGIQAGIVILVESLSYLWKVATWKNKLKNKTQKAIDKWAKELKPQFDKEINKSIKETKSLVAESIKYTSSDIKEIIEQEDRNSKFDNKKLDNELSRLKHSKNDLNKIKNSNQLRSESC